MRSPLGLSRQIDRTDYEKYESSVKEYGENVQFKWNTNHKVQILSELTEGQLVWVKTPNVDGFEAEVVRKDAQPDSYWVKKGESEVRRNRKHLFPFSRSPSRPPDEADASDGAGEDEVRPVPRYKVVLVRLTKMRSPWVIVYRLVMECCVKCLTITLLLILLTLATLMVILCLLVKMCLIMLM